MKTSTTVTLLVLFVSCSLALMGLAYLAGHDEGHRSGLCAGMRIAGHGESVRSLCAEWGYDIGQGAGT